MTLEHEVKQLIWESVQATEAATLARLSPGEEISVDISEVLIAKLDGVVAAVIRIARHLDQLGDGE